MVKLVVFKTFHLGLAKFIYIWHQIFEFAAIFKQIKE